MRCISCKEPRRIIFKAELSIIQVNWYIYCRLCEWRMRRQYFFPIHERRVMICTQKRRSDIVFVWGTLRGTCDRSNFSLNSHSWKFDITWSAGAWSVQAPHYPSFVDQRGCLKHYNCALIIWNMVLVKTGINKQEPSICLILTLEICFDGLHKSFRWSISSSMPPWCWSPSIFYFDQRCFNCSS